ncbi:MAG: hypothetical protein Q3966_01100 [Neisseria sp.]|nr:hypothetical protein [Neisseria sp.]
MTMPVEQQKRPQVVFSPAFKRGVWWMVLAFVLPLLLWTLFVWATLARWIPMFSAHWSWALVWLMLALPCLLTASHYFRWRGTDKLAWIVFGLAGYAVLSVPAALFVYFQMAQWLGVKLS